VGHFVSCLIPPVLSYSTQQCCLYLDLHESRLQVTGLPTRRSSIAVNFSIRYRYVVAACHYVLWREFYVRVVSWLCHHDCARTLKRSLAGKLAIVKLSSGFGFARISSRAPCALASFSRARIPRSACTRDVTCELYCKLDEQAMQAFGSSVNNSSWQCSPQHNWGN